MKRKRAFRITLTDEGSLERRASWCASPLRLGIVLAGVALLLMAVGAALVFLTPLRRLAPEYMPREQRAAAEMAYLRIDSLREAIRVEREYMASIKTALDTHRQPKARPDTAGTVPDAERPVAADSLVVPTEREARFTLAMQRREGFNLSVLAPLAAEGMVFCFPATSGVYGPLGSDGATQSVILARGASVRAVADGAVVGVTRSVRERGYVVWIQHDNGFMSRYSRLGTPLVDQGSRVEAGEAIAIQASGMGVRGNKVDIQLWHDGERLPPRRYLPDNSF